MDRLFSFVHPTCMITLKFKLKRIAKILILYKYLNNIFFYYYHYYLTINKYIAINKCPTRYIKMFPFSSNIQYIMILEIKYNNNNLTIVNYY